uniref:F-box associated beta-propeller type 3 domain-containing protein n=1 Tax=Leersia perrieri TaxID=77586 RepID=A0A0D9XFQ1_9ORYZ
MAPKKVNSNKGQKLECIINRLPRDLIEKIANLATGECLHLEKAAKNLTGDHFWFYSFGFHPVTKEYKVTHFLGHSCEARTRAKDSFSAIQVYTLGGEKWKYVGAPEALSLNCVKNSGVVNVDGTMYRLTEDHGASWRHAVMSSDLSEESFGRIQLPIAVLEDSALYGPRQYWIKEIDGKVCITTCQTTNSQPRVPRGDIQIWTLDINLEQRWIQKYIIQPSSHYIPGPNIVHRGKFVLQCSASNLYSYELLGKNVEVKLSNMERLLDFSPREPGNMQFYTFVKSLVRLDAYVKTSIVRRPKRQDGWELKKWKALERQRHKVEDTWKKIQQMEQDYTVQTKNLHTAINWLLQRQPDDEALKCISLKIDQLLHYLPDCPIRSIRRLNWVAEKEDMDNLDAHMDELSDALEARDDIFRMTASYLRDQGISIPTATTF